MIKQYYECHITMLGIPKDIRPLVESLKWKFSSIDGDPVLGDGVKCYATMFYNIKQEPTDILALLKFAAGQLKKQGVNVIRRKVEKVVYDDRSSQVNCNGGCPECHLEDFSHI